MLKRITPRDKLFCYELLADEKMNPETAALKVGYAKGVARTKAYIWVSNSEQNPKPQVKAFYDNLINKRESELGISAERIDKELSKIAFSNISDIIEKMGGHINLMKLKDLSLEEKHAIAEITETEFDGVVTRKIKMHNKIEALKTLLKRIGKDNSNQNLTINIIKDNKVIATKNVNGNERE